MEEGLRVCDARWLSRVSYADGLQMQERQAAALAAGTGPEAFFLLNKATQDFLIRPMGIFQLLDYVGWDVFRMILTVMGDNLPGETFRHDLADRLFDAGSRGGQSGSGEQKDGLFKYEKNSMTAIFDPSAGQYVPLSDPRFAAALARADLAVEPSRVGLRHVGLAKREGGTVYALLNRRLESLGAGELTRDLHVQPDFHGNRSPRADASLRIRPAGSALCRSISASS